MTALSYAAFALFPLLMAYAAASDLLSMTISNRVSILALAGFAIAAPMIGMDLSAVGQHLAAGGIVLAAGFFLFAMGWIGGGDAKLAAVASLWLGLDFVPAFLVLSAVYGGMLTIAILVLRRRELPAFAIRQTWLFRLHDPSSGVPYGIALSAAALLIFPQTVWIALVAV